MMVQTIHCEMWKFKNFSVNVILPNFTSMFDPLEYHKLSFWQFQDGVCSSCLYFEKIFQLISRENTECFMNLQYWNYTAAQIFCKKKFIAILTLCPLCIRESRHEFEVSDNKQIEFFTDNQNKSDRVRTFENRLQEFQVESFWSVDLIYGSFNLNAKFIILWANNSCTSQKFFRTISQNLL